jgi:hypothetical protein
MPHIASQRARANDGIVEFIKEPGGEVWVAEAPNWESDSGQPLKIAIALDAIGLRARRGFRHMIGQQYGVLGPGLILAEHVFQGLKREAYVRDDSLAGEKKLTITWAATRDAYFAGDPFDGRLEYREAPALVAKRLRAACVSKLWTGVRPVAPSLRQGRETKLLSAPGPAVWRS